MLLLLLAGGGNQSSSSSTGELSRELEEDPLLCLLSLYSGGSFFEREEIGHPSRATHAHSGGDPGLWEIVSGGSGTETCLDQDPVKNPPPSQDRPSKMMPHSSYSQHFWSWLSLNTNTQII